MSSFQENALAGVSYSQIKLSGSSTKNLEEEIGAIAQFIAETHIDLPENDAILTANGYANKEILRDSLVSINSNYKEGSLKAMLEDGACIYKAVYQQEIVGAAVIISLSREFSPSTSSQKSPLPSEVGIPDLLDLEAVEAYSVSGEKDESFYSQLCGYLNSHIRYYGLGKLWELSSLGVKKEFRHLSIGRTLVKRALAQVPTGHQVIIQTDYERVPMYKHLGFRYARSKSQVIDFITIAPEWENSGEYLMFPLMLLHKGDDELSEED